MTTNFKSEYHGTEAFCLRAELLRPLFGCWDAFDPVAHALLDIVEAQTELQDLFEEKLNRAALTAAVQKRHAAGKKLLVALEDRASWPDPEMGLRDED